MKCRILVICFYVFAVTLLYALNEDEVNLNEESIHYFSEESIIEENKDLLYLIRKIDDSKIFKENEKILIIDFLVENNYKTCDALAEIGIDSSKIKALKHSMSNIKSKNLKIVEKFRYNEKSCSYNEKPFSFYSNTDIRYWDLRFGLISQKDPGERNYFDYYSYFVEYQNEKSYIQKAIIGKYRLGFGQGLVFAPKIGGIKNLNPKKNLKLRSYIKPYSSSFEMWYNEGFALNFGNDYHNINLFYSDVDLDASMEKNYIKSFNESGLHINENDSTKVKEMIRGGFANFRCGDLHFDILGSHFKFDKTFLDPKYSSEYWAYEFQLHYDITGFDIIADYAIVDGKKALNIGLVYEISNFSQLVHLRSYNNYFPTWHAKPISCTSGDFSNQNGLFYNIEYKVNPKLKISAYYDLWKESKPQYANGIMLSGSDRYISINKKICDHFMIKLSILNKTKMKKHKVGDVYKFINFERNTDKIIVENKIQSDIKVKLYFEYGDEKYEGFETNHGFTLYKQIEFKIKRFKLLSRVSVIDSEVVHYVYENDLEGVFKTNISSGEDIRYLGIASYESYGKFKLQIKWSESVIKKDHSIGIFIKKIL